MSGGNNTGGDGWGSKFFKFAGAAVATAAAAGGLYALLSSSGNSVPEAPFQARGGPNMEPAQDPWSSHHENNIPSQTKTGIKWTKPEIGWVKLNVDGSHVHQGAGSAGCGGVLRDASGTWLHGFSQKLEPTFKVHETEIWAILKGLQVAWDKGCYKKLVVESDHKPVVDLVNNRSKSASNPHIDSIRELLDRVEHWEVRLTSIPREANRVANRLANDARNNLSSVAREFPVAPDNCLSLLREESEDVQVQRVISF